MSPVLTFFLAIAVGFSANIQQSGSAASPPPRRTVHLHLPPGTKIGPNDKIVPAKLKKRVNPVYPPLARQTRISGTVLLHVTISTEGALQDIEVVSGHPLLLQAALDAVKQWQYEPTLFNGEPVEVDTTIDVIFNLDDKKPSAESSGTPSSQTEARTPPMRVRMGPPIVANALLTHPEPVYPQEAKDKKIQGTVRVHVVIGTDGAVKEANAVSGDPLLTQPALDAVRHWTYRPTFVNGEPVEVDTQVVIIFELNGKKPKKEK